MARFKCTGECMRDGVPYCEMLEEVEKVVINKDGEEVVVRSYECYFDEEENY